MAYDTALADRLRERLSELPNIEEKEMMGGLVFMYNGKMCLGVVKDDLMCRIDPSKHEEVVERTGCRTMDFTKRPMIGYILVEHEGMKTKNDFDFWVELALEFNPKAIATAKTKKTKA